MAGARDSEPDSEPDRAAAEAGGGWRAWRGYGAAAALCNVVRGREGEGGREGGGEGGGAVQRGARRRPPPPDPPPLDSFLVAWLIQGGYPQSAIFTNFKIFKMSSVSTLYLRRN